jgi:Raf kinase inhibitor-like YbhB/YbcL family protein
MTKLDRHSDKERRMGFTLHSDDVIDGGVLPDAQVKAHGDTSPHLAWSGAPEGTRSFAVTCYDPDAPTGSGFWHWTVANIPADVTELATGASGSDMPRGAVEGRTDYGPPGFGGAAPPVGHGPHRYVFTVFAVDVDKLDVTPEDSGAKFGFNLHFHALAKAEITATYEAPADGA